MSSQPTALFYSEGQIYCSRKEVKPMPGARLIVNARYFHIARPGEAASKYALVPEAAAGLVNYIATRESVLLNFSAEY